MSQAFVHLQVHSDYSLLRSTAKISKLVAKAEALKMRALALTDLGNLFGAVEFFKSATSAGIKPILGMEVSLTRNSRLDHSGRPRDLDTLLLLARNEVGFKNLINAATVGYLEGFYHRPRLDYEFLEDHAEGLLAVAPGTQGPVGRELLEGRPRQAAEMAGRLKEIFAGDFWLGLVNHGLPQQRAAIPQLVDTAKRTGIETVATNDVYYLHPEEAEAQELLILIRRQQTVLDGNRYHRDTDQRYLKSAAEMNALFSALPESLRATEAIAERICYEMKFGNLLLPDFPLPEAFKDPQDYLEHLSGEGLQERYGAQAESQTIQERLHYELGIIGQMGYAGYFLIVRDFIHQARQMGIAVGPGRGSAAGSLVAYCLRITNIEPLGFGLLFERFLNIDRISMPDIDIDFDYRRRGEVIEYVKKKYGEHAVTQIITFGTMAARGVIRDVGRALGLSYNDVDRVAKLVPGELGITLDRALETVPELGALADDPGEYGRLVKNARTLEGVCRHASTHAAGVLIAPGRLDEVVPLFRSGKGEVSTQWDMKSSEAVGLLKMDFLGLRTLTVLVDCLKLIEDQDGTILSLDEFPLDDPQTFDLLKTAQTVGVFQLESAGMRDLLRHLSPESFQDIIAINALYRPGPMGSGMVTDFIDCRQGRKEIHYEHPSLEPILKSTYGMMVYQEQVMQIASQMAGFSLAQADELRRAMGKKKQKEMDAQRVRFNQGATERGIGLTTADKVFDQMAYFAGYGFNKSHSAAYAMISYQTAYLKTHFPAHFMAATLTSEMDSTDRIMVLAEECRHLECDLIPPDINASQPHFIVEQDRIRFGLGAIKNVGLGVIEILVAERERGGPFKDVFDLCCRVHHQALNKRVLESLTAAGALDCLSPSRARLYAAAQMALEAGSRRQEEQSRGQTNLFDLENGNGLGVRPELPRVPDWDRSERLRHEREALGFYLSDHPLAAYRDEIAAIATGQISAVAGMGDGSEVWLLGLVSKIARKVDKKGRTMGFVTLEDFSGSLECVLFSSVFEQSQSIVTDDRVIVVSGRLDRREPESDAKLVVEEVFDLENQRDRLEFSMHLKVPVQEADDKVLGNLRGILEKFPGKGRVQLHCELETGRKVRIAVGAARVGLEPGLIHELRSLLGEDAVRLGGSGGNGS